MWPALASLLLACTIIGLVVFVSTNPGRAAGEPAVLVVIFASMAAVVFGLVGLAKVKYRPSRAARIMATFGLTVGLLGVVLLLVVAALVETHPD